MNIRGQGCVCRAVFVGLCLSHTHIKTFIPPCRIKIEELPHEYTVAMHKIQVRGTSICSRCRWQSGCLSCDPDNCTAYWMRKEASRTGRPIDEQYRLMT